MFHFPPFCIPINSGRTPPPPVSHWHTNTQVKRMWSAAAETEVQWPFCMQISIFVLCWVNVKDKTQTCLYVCMENTMCVWKIQCVCVRVYVCVLSSLLPLLPLLGVNQSFYYLIRHDTPTVESALCNSRYLPPDYSITAESSSVSHLGSLHLPEGDLCTSSQM